MTIIGPKKGVLSLAAARFQPWDVLLSAHKYDIRYKATGDHSNADGLSWLLLRSTGSASDTEAITTFNIGHVQALLVTVEDNQQATR